MLPIKEVDIKEVNQLIILLYICIVATEPLTNRILKSVWISQPNFILSVSRDKLTSKIF